jgi:hypothetical protein
LLLLKVSELCSWLPGVLDVFLSGEAKVRRGDQCDKNQRELGVPASDKLLLWSGLGQPSFPKPPDSVPKGPGNPLFLDTFPEAILASAGKEDGFRAASFLEKIFSCNSVSLFVNRGAMPHPHGVNLSSKSNDFLQLPTQCLPPERSDQVTWGCSKKVVCRSFKNHCKANCNPGWFLLSLHTSISKQRP